MKPFWQTLQHARERKRDNRPRQNTSGDQEMVDLGEHPLMWWSRLPDGTYPIIDAMMAGNHHSQEATHDAILPGPEHFLAPVPVVPDPPVEASQSVGASSGNPPPGTVFLVTVDVDGRRSSAGRSQPSISIQSCGSPPAGATRTNSSSSPGRTPPARSTQEPQQANQDPVSHGARSRGFRRGLRIRRLR